MPLTLQEVREKLLGSDTIDPIADSLDEIIEEDGKIIVAGVEDETTYRDFLMFETWSDGVRLSVRAPSEENWDVHGVFYDWDNLHTWVYEL